MNRKAIELAVRMGLACHSEIIKDNYFARKNYFYPDLPKGYQLSQHTTPICKGGYVIIRIDDAERRIHLNRIHLEEDAGKSLHDIDPKNTSIDFNRAGVPLIEIVSEPDIRSGEEAAAYLTELRKLVRYLGICDGNMEQGSLRCDANISVRRRGDAKLGTKVEVKNLNSIRNVKRAVDFEGKRMIGRLEQKLEISQQTRSFDADNGTTFPIRDKEDADDYRYFPDPDLTKFYLTDELVEAARNTLPLLQRERIKKYIEQYGLSYYDASLLTDDKDFSDFFEQVIGSLPTSRADDTMKFKSAANWMLGPVRYWLNDSNKEIDHFPLTPQKIACIIQMIEDGKLSFSIASTRLFGELIKDPLVEPDELARRRNLLQDSNTAAIENLIEQVLNKFPEKVDQYKKGKKGLMGLFVGEVMKLSKGTADPAITNDILSKKLKS
jgi:aspartyl-tRNA(Asn)/glutamyl-tRNA(Gln) amidotransferase subunit B